MKKLTAGVVSSSALCAVMALPVLGATMPGDSGPGRPALIMPGLPQVQGMINQGLASIDTDKDGKISKDEFLAPVLAHIDSLFDKLDQNNDGVLTKDELTPKLPQPVEKPKDVTGKTPPTRNTAVTNAMDTVLACIKKADPDFDPPERPAPDLIADGFGYVDSNGDGKISLSEMTQAATARATAQFARLDRDGDGYLTKADQQITLADMQKLATATRDCMKPQK